MFDDNLEEVIAETISRQQQKWQKGEGCNGNQCTAVVIRRAATSSGIQVKNKSNKPSRQKSLAD